MRKPKISFMAFWQLSIIASLFFCFNNASFCVLKSTLLLLNKLSSPLFGNLYLFTFLNSFSFCFSCYSFLFYIEILMHVEYAKNTMRAESIVRANFHDHQSMPIEKLTINIIQRFLLWVTFTRVFSKICISVSIRAKLNSFFEISSSTVCSHW